MKLCRTCDRNKPYEEFYKLARGSYMSRCKECEKQNRRNNYVKYRQRELTSVKAWQNKNRDKHLQNCREYVKSEAGRNTSRKFLKKHGYYHNYISAMRFARKRKVLPPWLTRIQKRQIKQFYMAAWQIQKSTGVKMSVDHIIPINGKIVRGLHVPWNLQILSLKENMKKSNKLAA